MVEGYAGLVGFYKAGGLEHGLEVGGVEGEEKFMTGQTEISRLQVHICQFLSHTKLLHLDPSV